MRRVHSYRRQRFPQVPVVFFTCQSRGKQAFTQTNTPANIHVKNTPARHIHMRTQLMMYTPHFLGELSAIHVGIC